MCPVSCSEAQEPFQLAERVYIFIGHFPVFGDTL